MHEASLHHQNSFITLTYNNEHLPPDGSLNVKHFQKFMKRLRKSHDGIIRYYHCGEYGDALGRPHYHACLFGFDFPDRYLWTVTAQGERLYRSPTLEVLWPYGISSIGNVTFRSAAYVARYIMKKRLGPSAAEYYEKIDPETGEIIQLKPEYTTMSRRPGLAAGWFDKYKTDVYPDDFVIMNGKKFRPPRFYDYQLEQRDPELLDKIKKIRKASGRKHADNNTPDRLAVRETIQQARLDKLKRSLE
jgi:hypothetical protein